MLASFAGYATERMIMQRERNRADPAAGDDFRLADDAVHHEMVTSDGGSLHIVERGDPRHRPIVLLHGVTLTNDIWTYQLADLAGRFRVLAIDHRGHGRSTAGDGGYGVARLAADLAEALDHLDVNGAVLVGHSMGGMTVQQFAVDVPDMARQRVAGLVLMCTTSRAAPQLTLGPLVARGIVPASQRGLRLSARLPGGLLPSNDLSYLLMRVGFGKDPSPTHVELTRAIEAAIVPAVLSELLTELFSFDRADDIERIDRPTLVVAGELDHLLPVFHGREIAGRIPGAELVVLPGCGHMPMLERREQLAELIGGFAGRLARL